MKTISLRAQQGRLLFFAAAPQRTADKLGRNWAFQKRPDALQNVHGVCDCFPALGRGRGVW